MKNKIIIYKLFKHRQGGKKLPSPIELGLVECLNGGDSIRAWDVEKKNKSDVFIEYWLFHSKISLNEDRLVARGTEFLEDGYSEVVQVWSLVPVGAKVPCINCGGVGTISCANAECGTCAHDYIDCDDRELCSKCNGSMGEVKLWDSR